MGIYEKIPFTGGGLLNSLAKIAISFYVQLMHIVQRVDCEWETIDDLIKLVSAAATEAARLSVQAIVSIFNAEVFMSPMIARDGWRRKDKTMKTLETSIGVLFLERHTYQHKKSGKCVALLFEALGIKPHQRTSRELMFRVLDLCPEMSFRKAIHATGAQVCVQTAINWLRNKMPVLERIVTGDPRKAEVLHVFLDEDHLSMLKDPHRKHMILPVGAVAEGHTEERKGRFRLIHPFYFLSQDMTTRNLTDTITGYICKAYDMSVLKKIYVHGDGARWIGKALQDVCTVEYVFDGFHFERDLRRCCRRFGSFSAKVKKLLLGAIKDNNRDLAEAILTTFGAGTGDPDIMRKTDEFQGFLLGYWDAIRSRVASCPLGSCTEALVQHLASERFSSTPHGWSRKTVNHLSALRVFKLNGGSIHDLQMGQPAGTYACYLDECIAQIKETKFDFSIFDREIVPKDRNSGTQHLFTLIDSAGQLALGQ